MVVAAKPGGRGKLGPVTGTVTDFSPALDSEIDTVYTVKQVGLNATASGDTTVIALVASKKLRVIGIIFTVSAAVAVAWKSGATTTKIEAMSWSQDGGVAAPNMTPGWFMETDAGEALVVNLSINANVRGTLWYIEV